MRQTLLQKCERLGPDQLREIIDFAEFLLSKRSPTRGRKRPRPASLKRFVGGVSHGSLAQNIDNDLYNGAGR